jgi:heat shock protein HtpX
VFCFLLFFFLIGLSIDYLFLDAFTARGPSFPIATLIALGFSVTVAYTGYRQGSKLILSSVGAEQLDIQIPEHRELHNVVTEMALASGCPMPKVYVTYDPAPNAFATGRNEESAAICITTGLLTLLGREETQGVVAHEMAHIKNNDTLVMLLISVLLGGVVLLSDWAQRSIFGIRPFRRASSQALLAIPALLLIAISPLVSRLLAMAVSRQREYLADATAVEFTRNPTGIGKGAGKNPRCRNAFSEGDARHRASFFHQPLASAHR